MRLGWLSPEGDFFENKSHEHYWMADQIVKRLGINCGAESPDEIIMRLGYVHITLSILWNRTVRLDWQRPLTANQIYFLKDYINSSEFEVEPLDMTRFEKELDRV